MRAHRFFAVIIVLLLLGILPAQALAQGAGTYVVKPGDTLSGIAAANGTTAAAIMRANGLTNSNFIFVGQRLALPGGSRGTSGGSGGAAPAARGSYTIKAGDTLGAIAAHFGVSAAAIARANGLANPDSIRIGMRLVIPGSAGAGAGPATNPAPTGSSGTRFVASISQQTCWFYQGGVLAYRWRCSTGRPGAPTVPGTYSIRSKLPRAWGSTWGFWMPYWLGIYSAGSLENGIHGLPYAGGSGVKVWQNAVGTPVTFGCVLLDDGAAATLYNLAYVGMPVVVLP